MMDGIPQKTFVDDRGMEIYNNHSTSTCLNTFSIYYVLQVFKFRFDFGIYMD